MKIAIGKFDPATGSVPVTFRHAGLTHQRAVNACFDADGSYDAAATRARVDQVGCGVEAKIIAGAIGIPEAEVVESPAPAPDETTTA